MEDKKKKRKVTKKKEETKKTPKKVAKKNAVKEVEEKKVKTKPKKKVAAKKKNLEKIEIPIIEKEKKKEVKKEGKTKKEELLEKTYIFNKREKTELDEVISKLDKEKVESLELERNPLNRGLIIFLCLAIVGVIIFCIIYSISLSSKGEDLIDSDGNYRAIEVNDKTEDNSEINEEFQDVDYSNIVNTNINDFEIRLVEGKDMLVLISSQTCYYCIKFEPVLNSALVSLKDEVIRLNITKMSDEETKRLRTYYPFTAAPTLLYVKNGEVKVAIDGYMEKDEFINWYKENVK